VSAAPGNLEFKWSSWKIATSWQQSWDSCSPSKMAQWWALVGAHHHMLS